MSEKEQNKNGRGIRVIPSRELFGDQKIVIIEHEACQYRLLITRQGKLVLNK